MSLVDRTRTNASVSDWMGRIKRLPYYLLVIAIGLVTIGPFAYMIGMSLMKPGTIQQIPPKFVPKRPIEYGLHNYYRVLLDFDFFQYLLNSIIITSAVTGFNLVFDTIAGYVFAKLEFPGRKLLFFLILGTLMIPMQVTIVPLYLLMAGLGLVNTYISMTIPFAASAFGIFLMKQYMESFPSDLERAAMVDGCTRFEIFYKIVVPMSKPAIATLGIFTFIGTWNAFLWPLLMAQSRSMYTLEVALAQFQGRFEADIAAMMTGAVLTALPVVVLFVALQKYYIRGIKLSGIKG